MGDRVASDTMNTSLGGKTLSADICLMKGKPSSSSTARKIRWDLGSKISFCSTSFCEFSHSECLHYIFISVFYFIFVFVHLFWICVTEGRVSEGYSGIFISDRYQCSLSFKMWKLENRAGVWNSWWKSQTDKGKNVWTRYVFWSLNGVFAACCNLKMTATALLAWTAFSCILVCPCIFLCC